MIGLDRMNSQIFLFSKDPIILSITGKLSYVTSQIAKHFIVLLLYGMDEECVPFNVAVRKYVQSFQEEIYINK